MYQWIDGRSGHCRGKGEGGGGEGEHGGGGKGERVGGKGNIGDEGHSSDVGDEEDDENGAGGDGDSNGHAGDGLRFRSLSPDVSVFDEGSLVWADRATAKQAEAPKQQATPTRHALRPFSHPVTDWRSFKYDSSSNGAVLVLRARDSPTRASLGMFDGSLRLPSIAISISSSASVPSRTPLRRVCLLTRILLVILHTTCNTNADATAAKVNAMPMERDEVVKNADEKAGRDGEMASIVPDEGAIDKADGETGTCT